MALHIPQPDRTARQLVNLTEIGEIDQPDLGPRGYLIFAGLVFDSGFCIVYRTKDEVARLITDCEAAKCRTDISMVIADEPDKLHGLVVGVPDLNRPVELSGSEAGSTIVLRDITAGFSVGLLQRYPAGYLPPPPGAAPASQYARLTQLAHDLPTGLKLKPYAAVVPYNHEQKETVAAVHKKLAAAVARQDFVAAARLRNQLHAYGQRRLVPF